MLISAEVPPEISGDYLRAERERLGYSQDKMARMFRVSLNTYSRWERGRFLPHASGAIWMALEYLKLKRSFDSSDLLRALDQRMTETEALMHRVTQEREEFKRSLNNSK